MHNLHNSSPLAVTRQLSVGSTTNHSAHFLRINCRNPPTIPTPHRNLPAPSSKPPLLPGSQSQAASLSKRPCASIASIAKTPGARRRLPDRPRPRPFANIVKTPLHLLARQLQKPLLLRTSLRHATRHPYPATPSSCIFFSISLQDPHPGDVFSPAHNALALW